MATPETPHGAATCGAIAMNLDTGELWAQQGFVHNVAAGEVEAVTVALVVVVVACGGKPTVGPEAFGAKVTPPGALATVRPGMTSAEVLAAVPGAVDATFARVEGSDGQALLVSAWGPPDAEPDREHDDEIAWRSVQTGWRASLYCRPDSCDVRFHRHKPLEAMLAKIAPPDKYAQLRIGMPAEQVRKIVGDDLVWVDSAAGWRATLSDHYLKFDDVITIDKLLEVVDAVAGKTLAQVRAAPPAGRVEKTSTSVELTGWDTGQDTFSRWTVGFALDRVDIMPGARAAILAALVKRYGLPKDIQEGEWIQHVYSQHVELDENPERPGNILVEVR